jgi:hypothetical protein
MTKGVTAEPEGNDAKDYDPVLDREACTVRRKPPCDEDRNAPAEAPASASALQ